MIHAIFSSDFWGGMGFNGTLPWPQDPDHQAHFDRLTAGQVVVLGRRAWDDPRQTRPMPGRTVYVASNRPVINAGRIAGDIRQQILALEQQHPTQSIWIAGGPSMLIECMDILDRVYLTHHQKSFKIDTKIDLRLFLRGFAPRSASVASDFQSTMVIYEPLFQRNTSTASQLQPTDR